VVGSGTLVPSLSIGIALADDSSTPEQLLADADTALYRAKEGGRARWELFAPNMRDAAVARLRLREDLRQALAGGQLRLHYQPLVALPTGIAMGFEALLRWEHPERGLLLPADFLDELMHGDLACAATDWVIQSALTDAAQWPEHHGCRPFVSINISPEQLARADLTAIIDTHLRRTGIDADRVWIEVTEEALVAGSAQLSALRDLRSLGVHVALDDFGSGYAGLLALRDVPADIVKLDREFTRSLLTDSTTRAIVESVVALCARLGRTLVAEGLETAEDVAALHELGVELGQGWHLGRPSAWPRSEPAPVPRPPIDRRPA
jgi:EAL domain-containing protein (putative c-di-GMP-specific phosphodiesterase class I)